MGLAQKIGDAFFQIGLRGGKEVAGQLDDMRNRMNKSAKSGSVFEAFKLGGAAGAGFFVVTKALNALKSALESVSAAFQVMAQEVRDAYKRVSDFQKIADRLSTSFTWINRMRLIIADSNMSMEEFEQSMAAFQRNMETFSQGVGESKQTFEGLGITPEMLRSWGTLENQMVNIIDRLKGVSDASQRAGAAMRIFGEQGRKLMPLVQGNRELYEVLKEQADFIGLNILPESASGDMDNVRDSFVKMNLQMQATFEMLAYRLAPIFDYILSVVISIAKTFQDVVINAANIADSGHDWSETLRIAGEAFITGIGMAIGEAMRFLGSATAFAGMIGEVFAGVGMLISKTMYDFGLISDGAALKTWQAARELGIASREMKNFGGELVGSSSMFAVDLLENYKRWQELLEKEREARSKPPAEMIEAIRGVGDLFKGEALQRNASTMQRLYEKNNEILKAIRGAVVRTADAMTSKDTVVLKVAP